MNGQRKEGGERRNRRSGEKMAAEREGRKVKRYTLGSYKRLNARNLFSYEPHHFHYNFSKIICIKTRISIS